MVPSRSSVGHLPRPHQRIMSDRQSIRESPAVAVNLCGICCPDKTTSSAIFLQLVCTGVLIIAIFWFVNPLKCRRLGKTWEHIVLTSKTRIPCKSCFSFDLLLSRFKLNNNLRILGLLIQPAAARWSRCLTRDTSLKCILQWISKAKRRKKSAYHEGCSSFPRLQCVICLL